MLARLLALLFIAGMSGACRPIALPVALPATQAPSNLASAPAGWDAVLDQFFAPDSELCDAPGGVLLVDDVEGRFLQAVGEASIETSRAMKAEDRFEVGGITKSFTVALALMLQEDGVWSLDDPLSKWLPKVAARLPDGDKITLRHLAGNQSGLRDYADPLVETAAEHNSQTALARTYTPASWWWRG
ncbi:MAG: beta-lactamase family protein [Anaerolineales bacterium]|nr:beta-lactamase family protein [Anaerolineales bacterium]